MSARRRLQARARGRRGFTLVELLVVLSVIAILTVVAIPAVSSIMRSNDLNRATAMISDEFGFAHQAAVTRNADVQLRLYQIGLAGSTTDLQYRAFRSWISSATISLQGLDKMQYLPASVIISPNVQYSTLLDYTNSQRSGLTQGTETLPNGVTANYVSFLFRATGGTSVSPNTPPVGIWDLTIYQETAVLNASTGLPNNYATIQVDPVTSEVRTYRP
jgi:uncharacterized protein (TIGR02596 family)